MKSNSSNYKIFIQKSYTAYIMLMEESPQWVSSEDMNNSMKLVMLTIQPTGRNNQQQNAPRFT